MGTPTEPEPFGEDCVLCFPLGKTPLYAYVVFEGIKKCPGAVLDPPNDRPFSLIQNIEFPCTWYFSDAAHHISLIYTGGNSSLYAGFVDGPAYFDGYSDAICMKEFTNNLHEEHCGLNNCGYDGTARIYYLTDPIPNTLCETMGFSPGAGNLYHKTPTIANMADYRIANPKDKTNVLFRVDTSVINP